MEAREGMTETVEGFRLSPQQRRLWLLQERDGGGPYRTRSVYRVDADLDADRLRRAAEAVATLHEILRTTYARLPGMSEPLQVIQDVPAIRFEIADLAGSGPDVGPLDPLEGRFAGSSAGNAAVSDIAANASSRIVLRRRPAGRSEILFDLPALSADRATVELFMAELAARYDAETKPETLAEPPLQYADVSEWWSELAGKPASAPGLEFWRRTDVSGAGSRSPFWTEPARAGSAFDPRRVTEPLPEKTFERVDHVSGELGITPEIFFLACWCVLLQRLTGEAVPVGHATDGRSLDELRGAMGAFSRSLPLRVPLDRNPTFREAARRIDEAVAEQARWSDLFHWPVSEGVSSGSEPELAFAFEYAVPPDVRIAGAAARPAGSGVCFDRFRVRLSIERTDRGTMVSVDRDAARVDEETARSFAGRFLTIVESAAGAVDRPIGRLDVMPAEEGRRVLVEWNATRRDFPDARPILERFEDAAARFPAAVAVVGDAGRVTYGQLNARANRIGRRLREAGVAPDTPVALLVDRSVDMVTALLAIWKAGGAYVPLDPALPFERLAFLLEDTGARFLVTKSALAGRVGENPIRTFLLDGGEATPDVGSEHSEAAANLPPAAGPEHLAYIIFTSGSTGRPKGVAVEHRQLTNYVNAILEKLEPAAGSSFATVTTIAADLGNTSIFPALASGGRLHVISEQRSSDPEGLADDFSGEPVDYLKIVPSHLAALLSGSRPEKILPKRCLILGGEPSSWDLVEKVRALAPGCRVLNHYGPTEATVGATTQPLDSEAAGKGPVPVGRPLANCRLYILDANDEPVPSGVDGELHIAGAGLARGYFRRPELTAERFVERELGGVVERLYRTGDRARFRRDGAVELLGRTDDQVKIHGFRIEPGEIEAAIREHPAVREAVVLPREVPGAGKRLFAYVVARPGEDPAPADLRRFLLSKLPEFMVPSAFVGLPRLPLTPNGKIDRAALPVPDLSRGAERRALVAPETPAEKILAQVWAGVLGTEQFGIHDNFFELGGDSILAIQIIARAARAGLRLTPRQLFEHQTVASLAAAAATSSGTQAEQGAVVGPVPLTPIQRWFFAQRLRDPHHFNQSVLLESPEPFDRAALDGALAALLRHHDALRLRFRREGETWSQTNAEPEEHSVLSVVTTGGDRSAMERAATEAQAGVDLSRGPLVRAVLFDSGPDGPDRLLLAVHHLAVDGVSWAALLEDLERAYGQIRAREAPALAPKTTSFREWAVKLEALARSGDLEAEAPYWRSRASADTIPLPRDADGENTVGSARNVESVLTEEETTSLLQDVPAAHRSQINDALLSALADALAGWTGRRRFSIELEGHGREEVVSGVDLTRTVGWLTARFPVLLELPDSKLPAERLAAIKEQLRAIPRRGIGYGILRYIGRDGGGEPAWNELPEPLVSFNYLGQVDRRLERTSAFRILPSIGAMRSPRDRRPHLLTVEGKIRGGRLLLAWIYSESVHRRETIEALAAKFEESLRALIAQSRTGAPAAYVASDFPQSGLSQKDLDKLLAGLQSAGSGGRR